MHHGNHETTGMILVGIILPWALRLPSFRGGIPFRGRTKTFSNGLYIQPLIVTFLDVLCGKRIQELSSFL